MTPGSLILLHPPHATAGAWGGLPELLRSYGLDVIAPDIREGGGMRYVARASLVISAAGPNVPLVLVGRGAAGPLLPAVAAAQRAAHRPIGGYVFVDADLPVHRRPSGPDHDGHDHGHDHGHGNGNAFGPAEGAVPVPADWPEAPCGYLSTRDEQNPPIRQARLRGWPIRTPHAHSGGDIARALNDLIAAL
ncbi:hypothetical protein SAMN04489712_12445 [Thermomonospora echinospora]|uniref:Alpha/beta hydrolase family protein n=1 Tax=Thermomonospora echinospora TaxID=1992 RepID=A0A1H6DXC7_9ACTN|nr:hypothetical protein [Thermomonospora echinospora]SEG89734.1 hypothetical protein SAMN04489712_12445 [Thermomonospora echinospora]